MTSESPCLIEGGLAVDDRGQIAFVNDFVFDGVKRFYLVSNHRARFIRAWHGHRHESKYVFVAEGAALLGAVPIENWEDPPRDSKVHQFVLSSKKPSVLYIPAGCANGFMTLTANALIQFFSTSTMEESLNDDIRFDARYWDIWDVVER